jgi:hypothetical protein
LIPLKFKTFFRNHSLEEIKAKERIGCKNAIRNGIPLLGFKRMNNTKNMEFKKKSFNAKGNLYLKGK